MNNIAKYYNSFSGIDSLVFIVFPDTKPVCLGSVTTLTYSMYRDKKPVNILGSINIKGFTRGSRIVAGTMIFTVVNQNWVLELQEVIPWLNLNQGVRLKADELPLFDLMLVSANEYGASADMFIYGVDITDDGQVISIEDLFTENTLSFVARDIDTLKNEHFNNSSTVRNQYNGYTSGISTFAINLTKNSKLYTKLNNIKYQSIDYSSKIIEYQNKNNISTTGILDANTISFLRNEYSINTLGTVSNKNNAIIYIKPDVNSKQSDLLPNGYKIKILNEENNFYKTNLGYILKNDIIISEVS